jgi:predicted transcriptional regulator
VSPRTAHRRSTPELTEVLHVRISQTLRRKLKVVAAREDRAMRDVVEQALRNYFTARRAP